jgi:predicted DNA-binding protein with PD1-like motif
MEFTQFGSQYVVRLDKGEEVVETLKTFCKGRNISLASVSGIGAAGEVEVGYFHTLDKKFISRTFTGDLEIASLIGNVTLMAGETYLHLHISVADESQQMFGGHLARAVISATCEVIIQSIPGSVDREKSEEIGLNLLKFD